MLPRDRKKKEWHDAKKKQEDLNALNEKQQELVLRIKEFGIIDKLEAAFKEFNDAKANSPELINERTYTALITACTRCKQYELAEKVFIDLERRGIEPTEASLNSMIHTYVKHGETLKVNASD